MSELLAKSKPPLSLVQHTRDVMDTGEHLFGTAKQRTPLGTAWLRFFRLEPERYLEFHAALLAAAAFHDGWGKATDSFQDAVTKHKEQRIRHEHLNALVLAQADVRAWLGSQAAYTDRLQDVVLSAVLTHHLKARDEEAIAPRPSTANARVCLLVDHPDFTELMAVITDRLHLAGAPPALARLWSFESQPGSQHIPSLRCELADRLYRFERCLNADEVLRRLNLAVRAGLIAADAAASGLVRQGHDIENWLDEAFAESERCTTNKVWTEIITPRKQQLEQAKKWRGWSKFQENCERLPERGLLIEPCGAGKTLAAWRWIAARLAERPAARVLFLYPTRATATEGFRDYVSWAPEADAALMHGTAEFDIEGMFQTPQSPGDDRHTKEFEAEARLFALGFWKKRLFSATVDQFLAFMHHSYGPLCMLPVLADSVVVIDEVHSFDHGMFSTLRAFLQEFDVPVLCMTATLPEERREQLLACGLRVPDERPADLRQQADAPRYRLRRLARSDGVPELIAAAFRGGQRRVLWVVNQVPRAQEAWKRIGPVLPAGVKLCCYHSRFQLRHRRDRHNEVVAAFKDDSGLVLAITTSVCEMSLDLDADVLVTEECPITSLIQRMGRCHRSRELRHQAGEVFVYSPGDTLPYQPEELSGLETFLQELASSSPTNDLSQTRLEKGLSKHGPRPKEPPRASSFLNSGPYADAREESFRDSDDFTIPAVLERDVTEYLRLLGERRSSPAGLIVPVPRRRAWPERPRHARWPSYLAVAPDAHYLEQTGFWNQPQTNQGGEP